MRYCKTCKKWLEHKKSDIISGNSKKEWRIRYHVERGHAIDWNRKVKE
ncbi:MAG: hypothetical protein HYT70_03665 [Candidatus Aenigmarchaeota archaeon]|nr:hypothetical protein [Candidatus Aenigmarchaeota archaeon]